MRFAIEMLVALPVALLWLAVTTLLARPFGVQMPLTPLGWGKRLQGLSFPQYLIVGGILFFGCGILIMSTVRRYLEWRYWHGSPLTSVKWSSEVVPSLLAGAVFGLLGWSSDHRNKPE